MVRIVFCLPGRNYSSEFLLCWTDLLVECLKRNIEFVVSQKYSSVVHFARSKCLGGNILAGPNQAPFKGIEYDYMMWIDSDIIFNTADFFKLLKSPHDVTAGLYLMENMKTFPIIQKFDPEYLKKNGNFELMREENLPNEKYVKVDYAGMGWMLIKRGVVEKIRYPWFYAELQKWDNIEEMVGEDIAFCMSINSSGTDIYIDTSIRVGHQKLLVI
jgi:hypothetical protein